MEPEKKISENQQSYWKQKLSKHNKGHESIGSESVEHKHLRYQRISRILVDQVQVSVLDVGAGFGDYFDYLINNLHKNKIQYTGTEITAEFCEIARSKYPGIDMINANILEEPINHYDFVQMSGLFHQRGEISKKDWKIFMINMLSKGFEICKKGISFNVLSTNVDFERTGNFYVNTSQLYQYLSTELSRFIIIDQSYPLFEVTFHVLKKPYVLYKLTDDKFLKYLS